LFISESLPLGNDATVFKVKRIYLHHSNTFLLAPVEGLSYKPKYRAKFFFYSLFYILILFLLYSLPLGSAYCLSISLKRTLLIQVYTRSGTLHWFVVVALPYHILITQRCFGQQLVFYFFIYFFIYYKSW